MSEFDPDNIETYVDQIAEFNKDEKHPVIGQAKALYEYEITQDGDIELQEGDIIDVEFQGETDWWVGINKRTGHHGMFPGSFCEMLDDGGDVSPSDATVDSDKLKMRRASEWDSTEVCKWLSRLPAENMLEKYEDTIKANSFCGKDLITLEDKAMLEKMGVKSVGHKHIIKKYAHYLRSKLASFTSVESNSNSLNTVTSTVARIDGKFGISISGGVDTVLSKLYITKLTTAHKSDPPLSIGDQIIAIEGRSVEGLLHRESSEILLSCSGESCELTVLHLGLERWNSCFKKAYAAATLLGDDIKSIVVEKVDGKLCMSVAGGTDTALGYVHITGFSPKINCNPFLEVGDVIMEVEGINYLNMKQGESAKALIANKGNTIRMTVARIGAKMWEKKRNTLAPGLKKPTFLKSNDINSDGLEADGAGLEADGALPESIALPECSGWLTKQGGSYKSWKRRFMVLQHYMIKYYAPKKGTKANFDDVNNTMENKGTLDLRTCTSVRAKGKLKGQRGYYIEINMPDRVYYFYADSEADMKRWADAMDKTVVLVNTFLR